MIANLFGGSAGDWKCVFWGFETCSARPFEASYVGVFFCSINRKLHRVEPTIELLEAQGLGKLEGIPGGNVRERWGLRLQCLVIMWCPQNPPKIP